jgi:RHS repeat-associated protein
LIFFVPNLLKTISQVIYPPFQFYKWVGGSVLKRFLCFILCAVHLNAFANDSSDLEWEIEPTTLIHGCVDAISGSYHRSEQFLEIPAPIPFVYSERLNSGGESSSGFNWKNNHPFSLNTCFVDNECEHIQLETPGGGSLTFSWKGKRHQFTKYWLNPAAYKYGLTNDCGEISAKNNLRNSFITFQRIGKQKNEKGLSWVTASDGSEKFYNDSNILLYEILPNGNRIEYVYKFENNRHQLLEIIATDKTKTVQFGSFKIWDKGNGSKVVIASNGREVAFHSGDVHAIEESIYNHISGTELLDYSFAGSYIGHKNEDRRLHIKRGDRTELSVQVFKRNEKRQKLVHSLHAPDRETKKNHQLYEFDYHFKKQYTDVRNAYRILTRYKYDDSFRVTEIESYVNNDKLYVTDCFSWGETPKDLKNGQEHVGDAGCLLSKGRKNSAGKYIRVRDYQYDQKGNPIKESLYGNLSGLGAAEFKSIRDKNVESFSIHRTYSSCKYNLLLSEEPEGGAKICYSYNPNSNQLIRKLEFIDGRIQKREFFVYDDWGFLVESIADDGCSEDSLDLAGVTCRIRKRIEFGRDSTQSSFCLPVQKIEEYFDCDLGCYCLLKRSDLYYNKLQHLIQEDVYDRDEILAFAIHRDYDSMGNMIFESDPDGVITRWEFDQYGNKILEEREGAGYRIDYSYDKHNQCKEERWVFNDGHQKSKQYRYDLLGKKIAEIDPFGGETELIYDALGKEIQKKLPEVELDSGLLVRPSFQKVYDSHGFVCKEIDPAGNITLIDRNIRGDPIRTVYPDGSEERFHYYLNGKLHQHIKKNGSVDTYEYDQLGREINVVTSDSTGKILAEKSKVYSALYLLKEIDERGVMTEYEYDSAGRKISMRKGSSFTTYLYDSLGRPSGQTQYCSETGEAVVESLRLNFAGKPVDKIIQEGNGKILSRSLFVYDVNGNLTKEERQIADTEWSIWEKVYNDEGNPISYINPEGHCYTVYYIDDYRNDLGQTVRLKGTLDPQAFCTLEEFNTHNHLVSSKRIDPQGNLVQLTEYRYDINGNKTFLVETVLGQQEKKTFTVQTLYNSMGQKIAEIQQPDSIGRKTEYIYDNAGHLVETKKSDGISIYQEFDGLDRLIHLYSSDQTVDYLYSYDGKLIVQTVDQLSHASVYRGYDEHERLIDEKMNDLSMKGEYDSLGRLIKFIYPDQSYVQYNYGKGVITEVVRYDSSHKAIYTHRYEQFDLIGRPKVEVMPEMGGKITQAWNLLGRKIGIEHKNWSEKITEIDSTGKIKSIFHKDSIGQVDSKYNYDKNSQIISESGKANHTYEYDSLRNRLKKDGKQYSINELNQVLNDSEVAYEYDLCGNVTRVNDGKIDKKFVYDALGRLTQIEMNGEIIRFVYDSYHRLTQKYTKAGCQYYLYAADLEIGSCYNPQKLTELKVISPLDQKSIALEISDKRYYPIYDLVGNLSALVNGSGKIVENYRFGVFGEEKGTGKKKESITPWRYADKRIHEEADLILIGRRFYQPTTGRWITPDPIGFVDSPNLYMFNCNNPLYYKDPNGLKKKTHFHWGSELRRSNIRSMLIRQAFDLFTAYTREETRRYFMENDNSHEMDLGLSKKLERMTVLFINGIQNEESDWIANAKHISELMGDINVRGVYNETHGMDMDLRECDLGLTGVATKPAILLAKLWEKILTENPDEEIIQVCHSQGGIHVFNALELINPELRNRISVVAIAPAKFVPRDKAGYAINYISGHDFVPYLQIGYDEKGFFSADNVTHLTPHAESPVWDHAFVSPTYKKALRQELEEIVNRR